MQTVARILVLARLLLQRLPFRFRHHQLTQSPQKVDHVRPTRSTRSWPRFWPDLDFELNTRTRTHPRWRWVSNRAKFPGRRWDPVAVWPQPPRKISAGTTNIVVKKTIFIETKIDYIFIFWIKEIKIKIKMASNKL